LRSTWVEPQVIDAADVIESTVRGRLRSWSRTARALAADSAVIDDRDCGAGHPRRFQQSIHRGINFLKSKWECHRAAQSWAFEQTCRLPQARPIPVTISSASPFPREGRNKSMAAQKCSADFGFTALNPHFSSIVGILLLV
jgi:hypothetical protein